MSLQPLPANLTPEQVEKLRWDAFAHKRALSLKSADDLVRFTQRRGFVLLGPHAGVHYPSVLEAAVGRPLLDFTWDERSVQLERWKIEALASRRLLKAAVLGGRGTLLAPAFLADFYALTGHRGDLQDHLRRQAAGKLTADATALCSTLLENGPLPEDRLRDKAGLGGESRRQRFAQAMAELDRSLLCAQSAVEKRDEGPPVPVFDLLPRLFPQAIDKSRSTSPEAARAHIACRYLRNVLLEASHEMARVLAWNPEETLATLRGLVGKHLVVLHPASRPQRHLFQATTTDVLLEEPRRRKASGAGATGGGSPAAEGRPAADQGPGGEPSAEGDPS